jgi:hypothetical protein
MNTWTITDMISGETLTGTADKIASFLPARLADAPSDVTDAIGELADALRRGECTDDLEFFLAFDVQQA